MQTAVLRRYTSLGSADLQRQPTIILPAAIDFYDTPLESRNLNLVVWAYVVRNGYCMVGSAIVCDPEGIAVTL